MCAVAKLISLKPAPPKIETLYISVKSDMIHAPVHHDRDGSWWVDTMLWPSRRRPGHGLVSWPGWLSGDALQS